MKATLKHLKNVMVHMNIIIILLFLLVININFYEWKPDLGKESPPLPVP